MTPDSSPQTVGPWILGDHLGGGGNAQVWSATRASSDTAVALKVINVTRVDREPYQRFVREISFLREHPGLAGVLPLLDAYLPDQPSRRDQPWLAMPIATPMAEALEGKSLVDVVEAVAAIADTLARLEIELNVAHRDIKPGNLYELNGASLIGDFGLIAVPDAEPLTAEGRQVGPAHYTAYEMILNPVTADPHPADVYSLGKTLWVLATGQRFPPEGHQPVGTRGFEIGDFRPHARADALDREVSLMTRLRPEERPSKTQVARDLTAWLELAAEPVEFDVSDARARLRARIEPRIAEQDAIEQHKELAQAAVRRLQELTKPLNEGLKRLYSRTQIDLVTDKLTLNLLQTRLYMGDPREIVFRWQRCTLIVPFDLPGSTALRMSRSLEIFDDGQLTLRLWVHVAPEGVAGGYYFDWQNAYESTHVGSVEAEKVLEDGIRDLSSALKNGVDAFVDHLPESEPQSGS